MRKRRRAGPSDGGKRPGASPIRRTPDRSGTFTGNTCRRCGNKGCRSGRTPPPGNFWTRQSRSSSPQPRSGSGSCIWPHAMTTETPSPLKTYRKPTFVCGRSFRATPGTIEGLWKTARRINSAALSLALSTHRRSDDAHPGGRGCQKHILRQEVSFGMRRKYVRLSIQR